jgi:hypothetical protein
MAYKCAYSEKLQTLFIFVYLHSKSIHGRLFNTRDEEMKKKKKGMTIRGMGNAVCGVFIIQGVFKMSGKTSGVSAPHQTRQKGSYQYMTPSVYFSR